MTVGIYYSFSVFLARKELLKVREDEIMRLMYIGRFNRNAELFLENYTAYT